MKSAEPRIGIITLNWNGYKDTIECLESLSKLSYDNYFVVVIDNGSENDSVDKLESWLRSKALKYSIAGDETAADNASFEKFILIPLKENVGFAAGNNIGIGLAERHGADYAYLLNNDTVSEADSLSILSEFMVQNSSVAAVTPQIRYYDRQEYIWNCGGELSTLGFRKYFYSDQHFSKIEQKKYFDITMITGCALLFDFRKTGLLTEDFFFGEEDFEFSWRMKNNKWKMACVIDAIVYHKVSSSMGKKSEGIGKTYIYYLNRYINVKHHTTALYWYPWKYLYLLYIYRLLKEKYPAKQILSMFGKLLTESSRLNKVDKKYFFESLKM